MGINNEQIKIVIAGNPGSFANSFCDHFSSVYGFDFIFIDLLKFEKDNFLDFSVENIYIKLIYIGGESRDVKLMYYRNFVIPVKLLELMGDKVVSMIYLSSLSALPHKLNGFVSPKSSGKLLQRSIYSVSKREFDIWVSNFLRPKIQVVTLFPASIFNPSRGGSSIQKLIFILNKFRILRFLKFSGVISFCSRNQIYDKIISSLRLMESADIIICNNVSIRAVQEYVYGSRPSLMVPDFNFLLRVFGGFMPIKLYMLLANAFSTAIYHNVDEHPVILSCNDLTIFLDQI